MKSNLWILYSVSANRSPEYLKQVKEQKSIRVQALVVLLRENIFQWILDEMTADSRMIRGSLVWLDELVIVQEGHWCD